MKPTNKIFLYGLYAIVALVASLYFRFPSELIKEIVLAQVHKARPEVQLDTDVISPTIPPGIKLEPLLVSYAKMPILRMDDLRITPDLFSLIGSNRHYAFKGNLGTGELNGKVDTDTASNAGQTQISLSLTRTPLAFLEIFNQIQSVRPDGEMDAKINFDSNKGGGTAEVNLEIMLVHIALDPPVMGLEALEFDRINAQLTVSPRAMQIRNCDASGDQLEGKLTGSVVFRNPMEESKITLSLTLKPQPAFIAEHKNDMIGGLLSSDNAQKRGLVFRISGTFKNPNYVIR